MHVEHVWGLGKRGLLTHDQKVLEIITILFWVLSCQGQRSSQTTTNRQIPSAATHTHAPPHHPRAGSGAISETSGKMII